jgi:hypothetical protein
MIAAIIEREQREARVPAEFISAINRGWVHRNLNKRLEPVLAERAAGGVVDKGKFDDAVALHEEEVRLYLEERQAEIDRNFAVHRKIYRETLANRKAALDRIAVAVNTGNISPALELSLDKPVSVFGQPAAFVVDEHIESGNSWAKVVWSSNDPDENPSLVEKVRFWYSWQNDSADDVVITSAASWLTVAGKCSLSVNPGWFTDDSTVRGLWGDFHIYTPSSSILGTDRPDIAAFLTEAKGKIYGGIAHTDVHNIFRTVVPAVRQEVLVQANALVVFSVDMVFWWNTHYGGVKLEFDQEPFVNCPFVTIGLQPLGG